MTVLQKSGHKKLCLNTVNIYFRALWSDQTKPNHMFVGYIKNPLCGFKVTQAPEMPSSQSNMVVAASCWGDTIIQQESRSEPTGGQRELNAAGKKGFGRRGVVKIFCFSMISWNIQPEKQINTFARLLPRSKLLLVPTNMISHLDDNGEFKSTSTHDEL